MYQESGFTDRPDRVFWGGLWWDLNSGLERLPRAQSSVGCSVGEKNLESNVDDGGRPGLGGFRGKQRLRQGHLCDILNYESVFLISRSGNSAVIKRRLHAVK